MKRKARNGESSGNRFKRKKDQLRIRADALAPKQGLEMVGGGGRKFGDA